MKNGHFVQPKQLETIVVLALACLVIGLISGYTYFFVGSAVFLVIGLFFKRSAQMIARWWLSFAVFIGTVNSRLILTIVYFFILTPIAMVFRVAKGDLLRIKRCDRGETSLWQDVKHQYESKDLDNLW